MSSVLDEIRDQMAKFSSKFGPEIISMAEVVKLNDDDTIAVITAGGDEIDDVRLKSVIKAGNKLIVSPKVGSVVIIGKISNTEEWLMLMADEVEKITLEIGELRLDIDEDGLLLQKDNDTLKEALNLIIESVQKIVVLQGNNPDYIKLNEAKNMVNNLLK